MNTSKIIKGVVNNGRYTVTAPIVKEDYGLYLQIEGVELPETYQVDFSNSENSGTSVTMIGNADGVLIPRQFIASGKDVFAFLYHVGEDFGRTVYKFRIPNKVRPDRTDEEPTPEEQSVIDQTIAALNEAVEKTAQDVASADQSAQSASADAERAEDAKTDAQNFATQAEQSAINADLSATNASASASASAQSASNAETARQATTSLVAEAQGYADASEQGAMASANSAEQAHQFAQTASLEAESAQDYATQADISANTASNKASEASTSAQTASQKATESAQSATNAQGYAQTAESAKTASQTAQGLAESARDSAVQAKTDAESAKADAETARDEAQQAVASISGALADKAPIITDTASGAIASFSDGADDLPLKSLVVDINPIQDLSNGDPSPENLCPISGWTQVGVEQRGKNVFSSEITHGLWTTEGRFYSHDGGSSKYLTTKTKISVVGGLTYHISYSDDADNIIVSISCLLWNGNDPLRQQYINTSTGIISIPNDVDHITLNFVLTTKITTISSVSTGNFQLELGSTATPYEPYTGCSITIDLGQTVYGGKLDVLTGELVVDRVHKTYNGTKNWSAPNLSNPVYYALWNQDKSIGNQDMTQIADWLVAGGHDYQRWGTYRAQTNGAIAVGNLINKVSGNYKFADASEFKAYLAEHPLTVCYKIATPITIQLTPHEVSSLLGVNNILADSGDTEVEYRADTKLYISKKIAEAIASLT